MLNSIDCIQKLFLQQGLIHLAFKVITYLDIQTLYSLITNQQKPKQQQISNKEHAKQKQCLLHKNKIKNLIKTYYYIKEYLNKTDRSMYYSFYEEPQFIQIQKSVIQHIVIVDYNQQQQVKKYSKYFQTFETIFKRIQTQIEIDQDQLLELKRIFSDPSLPLPGLKRENQGLYCNSTFQLFLVGLRFSIKKQQFTCFHQLKQKIQSNQQNYLKIFLQIQKQKTNNPKKYQQIHFVRYTPYEITQKNYTELILPQHQLHNFVVYLFVLTQVYIQSFSAYIDEIVDPFYKFSEIMSRYSIFRSFVMEIQENLGFVFQYYDTLYSDSIRDSIPYKPQFCFWRPAMTKWFIKMNKIYNLTNQVYFMILTKLREENILSITEQYPLIKKHQISIKNNIQLKPYSLQLKNKIYTYSSSQSLLQDFIQNNPDTMQSLIFQYVEYIIDLAINEKTVHWCGHSKHKVESPYNIFNQNFKTYNQKYLLNLKDSCSNIYDLERKKKILQILLQQQVNFLQMKNIKPLTLREIIEQINDQKRYFQEFGLQKGQLKSELIIMDFKQKDQRLKYFNQKAKICESIQGEQKYFFSIPPLISPQQLLIKSIDTKTSSDNQQNDDNSSYEYISQNGEQSESIGNIDEEQIDYVHGNIVNSESGSKNLFQWNNSSGNK